MIEYLYHQGIPFRYLNDGDFRESNEIEFILHRTHKEMHKELSSNRIAVVKEIDAYRLVNVWNSPVTNKNLVWHYWIERV